MVVAFPRDLVLEAYLGRWVNITALAEGRSLRQVEPVKVSWGLPNEQGRALAPPSTAEGVLNNTGGHWTTGNPMSDYYDYLQGRNVPTRLALRVSRDSFTRTIGPGFSLGTSDTGDGWSTGGVNDSYQVNGSVAIVSISAVSSFGVAYLGDSYGDSLAALSMPTSSIAFIPITGGAVEPLNLVQRYQPGGAFAGEHYLLRVEIRTDNAVYVAIYHNSLGALTGFVGPISDSLGALSQNVALRAKFQAEGQTLRGKIYRAGSSNDPDQYEPLGWQVSAHHERLTGGHPGFRSGVAAGNTNTKPISYHYDDWELRLARHTGELTKLQPKWDTSHRHKTAAFKAAGVTQRLGRPNRPALSSAARRYLASNAEFTATDFWPLDEAATAPLQGQNAVAGGAPARFVRFAALIERGAVAWGETDPIHTSVPGFVTLSNDGELILPTNRGPLASVSSVMWAMKLSPDAGAHVFIDTNVGSQFAFVFYTDPSGDYELFGNPGSVSLATGTIAPSGLANRWVTMGLTIFNNGGTNIGYHLNVDGDTRGVGNWAAGVAYSSIAAVRPHADQPTDGGEPADAFSCCFLTAARFDTIIAGTSISYGSRASNVLKGWVGERALARAFRLCAEEGVPFDYWGDLGLTRPMGPQRPIPLLDQLVECAELDGALLYEPRYTPGVAMRGRRVTTAAPAVANLSYASGHLAPQFAPAADDRPTANLVRAERTDGGFYLLDTPSGPMNTRDPGTDPDAVGKSPAQAKVNAESDASLPDVAGWVRALGTVPEVRFPRVTVDLAARELTQGADPTLPARQVLQLNVGDRLLVTGLASADVYRDLDQLVRGGVETYTNVRRHRVELHTVPYEKYRAGVYGDAGSRYDGAGLVTTLDAQLGVGVTGARNVTTAAGPVWTTAAGAFPMDVVIGGERITLSGITGAGAAQVMTISARAVNGVSKTHPAGTKVYLFGPVYYC